MASNNTDGAFNGQGGSPLATSESKSDAATAVPSNPANDLPINNTSAADGVLIAQQPQTMAHATGGNLTWFMRVHGAMRALNQQDIKLRENVQHARQRVVDAETLLALAKKDLKLSREAQEKIAPALQAKRMDLSFYVGHTEAELAELAKHRDLAGALKPYRFPDPEETAPEPPMTAANLKRRQDEALADSGNVVQTPPAKRLATTNSAYNTRKNIKPSPQTPSMPVAAGETPRTALRIRIVHNTDSATPPQKKEKPKSLDQLYLTNSPTLVPTNAAQTEFAELRCCYCGGNTANGAENRHMRGLRGFQMHLQQVHGHKIQLINVLSYCKYRDVPLDEVKKIEAGAKQGLSSHIELIQSERNMLHPDGRKISGEGGWLAPPTIAPKAAAKVAVPQSAIAPAPVAVNDGKDMTMSDGIDSAISGPTSAVNDAAAHSFEDGDRREAASGLMTLANEATARRQSMEL